MAQVPTGQGCQLDRDGQYRGSNLNHLLWYADDRCPDRPAAYPPLIIHPSHLSTYIPIDPQNNASHLLRTYVWPEH